MMHKFCLAIILVASVITASSAQARTSANDGGIQRRHQEEWQQLLQSQQAYLDNLRNTHYQQQQQALTQLQLQQVRDQQLVQLQSERDQQLRIQEQLRQRQEQEKQQLQQQQQEQQQQQAQRLTPQQQQQKQQQQAQRLTPQQQQQQQQQQQAQRLTPQQQQKLREQQQQQQREQQQQQQREQQQQQLLREQEERERERQQQEYDDYQRRQQQAGRQPIQQPQPNPNIPQNYPVTTKKPARPAAPTPFDKFSTQLFQVLGPYNPQLNLVYSPLALHTLLAFVYMGASGATEAELKKALSLQQVNKNSVPQLFTSVLNSQKQGAADLVMANKMYYSSNLVFQDDVNKPRYFNAESEPANFDNPSQVVHSVNNWVGKKTNNKIKNLITSSAVDPTTQALLVNAIYFRGSWEHEFGVGDTTDAVFHAYGQKRTNVKMMFIDETFPYADLSELGADIIELPYKDSEISMLIILPKNKNGLADLESRLSNIDLKTLTNRLSPSNVQLRLPRFQVEFEIDMLEPLKLLQIRRLFSSQANLDHFFGPGSQIGVSKVLHKAVLKVNEAGSEAAAASYAKLVPLSLPVRTIEFTVDHPFIFAIRGPDAVYFAGHVVNI